MNFDDNLTVVNFGTDFVPQRLGGGVYHNLVLSTNGSIKAWGDNQHGQLGYGDTNNRGDNTNVVGSNLSIIDLGAGFTVTDIISGRDNWHSCALLENGTDFLGLKCWGWNYYGQLGLNDDENRGDDANEMGSYLPFISFNFPPLPTPSPSLEPTKPPSIDPTDFWTPSPTLPVLNVTVEITPGSIANESGVSVETDAKVVNVTSDGYEFVGHSDFELTDWCVLYIFALNHFLHFILFTKCKSLHIHTLCYCHSSKGELAWIWKPLNLDLLSILSVLSTSNSKERAMTPTEAMTVTVNHFWDLVMIPNISSLRILSDSP